MPTKIAFATSREISKLLEDDLLVARKLASQNIQVEPAVWDDKSLNWSEFDAVIVRSPWDYFLKRDAYYQWVQSFLNKNSSTKFLNPPQAILDNIDKRYLLEFEQQGIAIIPTYCVEKQTQVNLQNILEKHSWDNVVIKPVISAGAYGTWRSSLDKAEEDQEKLIEQISRETVFIQPFMPEIQAEGEWSIMYFNGEYSHSVLKSVTGDDFRIQEEFGGTTKTVEPTADILKQTQKIMDLQTEPLLYARVDGVIRDGQFLLMELEINEPSLFFEFSPKGVENFTAALIDSIK